MPSVVPRSSLRSKDWSFTLTASPIHCTLALSFCHCLKDHFILPPVPPPVHSPSPPSPGSRCITIWSPLAIKKTQKKRQWHGQEVHQEKKVPDEQEEDNKVRPEKTTAATARLSFQHLSHAECSSRSVGNHAWETQTPSYSDWRVLFPSWLQIQF